MTSEERRKKQGEALNQKQAEGGSGGNGEEKLMPFKAVSETVTG
jgi:hypothetical protein